MEEKLEKKKKIIIVVPLILLILVIGISYAAFYYNFLGTDNSINVEPIELKLLESTDEIINIENALPMSDAEGIAQSETFDFAVTTRTAATTDIIYDLKVEKLSVDSGYTTLEDSDIRVYLTDYNNNTLVNPTKISDLSNYKLYTDKNIHNNTTTEIQDKYKLRVWIDQDVSINNWDENTKLQYKLKIGVNTVNEEETLEGDGQTFHKMAPSTLTFRSTTPLDEFQEVQINGQIVYPSNYTLTEGSTIVTLNIDYLQTLDVGQHEITVVSESGAPSADFDVVLPDVNAHNFYYEQPYVGEVSGMGEVTAIFHENGTVDILVDGNPYQTTAVKYEETTINIPALGVAGTVSSNGTEISIPGLGTTLTLVWEQSNGSLNDYGLYYSKPYVMNDEAFVFFENGVRYYIQGENFVSGLTMGVEYSDNTFYIPYLDVTGNINSNGTEISIPSLGTDVTYVLSDNYLYEGMRVNIGDYVYKYRSNGTWNVEVMDRRKSSYGAIKSEVKGLPVTSMENTFGECTNLTKAPAIPEGVTNMDYTFYGCTSLGEAPVIPESVTSTIGIYAQCPLLNSRTNIYSFSTDDVNLGNKLESINGYTSDYKSLNKTFFLKHNIGNFDRVESQEVCYILNNKQYCLKGGDKTYYEINKTTLLESFGEAHCSVDSYYVDCSLSGLNAEASDNGLVRVYAGDVGWICIVNRDGTATCYVRSH